MIRFFKHIFSTVFLLVLFFSAKAQDTEELMPPPVRGLTDSVFEEPVSKPNQYYHFHEVTTPPTISTRKIPEKDLATVRSDESYWYVNEAPPREKKKASGDQPKKIGLFTQNWFKILFWILLIGGFVALLVWFLATGNVFLFRKSSKPVTEDRMNEEPTEDIFELNFEKEIQKAIDAANYRMAVRLMYLRTLRDLSLRDLIAYTHEKTNSDYLMQLAGSPYYKNFFRLTRSFDYTWYGQFPLSKDSFSHIQNDFSTFKQQLS